MPDRIGILSHIFRIISQKPTEAAMPAIATKGYLVRKLAEAPTVPCPCGESTRPLTRVDTPACNLHVTFIKDSVKHYHKGCTEVYYILEGQGKMELAGDVIDIEPNMIVYIEPYTPHRLWSMEGVRTIVFGTPALNPEDEYFD
jgi:mannose-6-phosphate isomerase-like protein (cupin superfamily)